MFGLFKRTKLEYWEKELLCKVLMKLPKEYSTLMNQISEGLIKGVLLGMGDIPGYVAFTFNADVLRKYDRKNEWDFKLTNIKVYDNIISDFVSFEIYVSSGTISGYSLGGGKKHNIDLNKINVSNFKKEFIGKSDYDRIADILDSDEKKFLNPSEVYSVYVNGKEYFHVRDLEDGDFFGIDDKKVVYKITHDPLQAVSINKKLAEVLNAL